MGRIKVVRRNAEVSQQAIHTAHTVITQEGSEVAEVAANKDEPRIARRGIGLGVGVLIESEESALGTYPAEDGTAMPTAPKRSVDIDASG